MEEELFQNKTDGTSIWRDKNGAVRRQAFRNFDAYYSPEGKRHRVNGPALIIEDVEQYWINGTQISKEEHDRYRKLSLFW